jgi:hypothetical protein
MRARARVFIATSVDGFIARADGTIDWLRRAHAGAPAGEDFGHQHFFDRLDGLATGRRPTREADLTAGLAAVDQPRASENPQRVSRRRSRRVATMRRTSAPR